MNKKIIYGIFFVSIFLLSTVSMVQPARGYSFGVPKEGIGTTSEGEVKLYDEDDWEDHLGSQSSAADVFGGDNDVVGAKSKTTVKELETDEDLISYEKDHAWKEDAIPGALAIELTIDSLIDSTVLVDGKPALGNGMVAIMMGAADHSNQTWFAMKYLYAPGYVSNQAYDNATANYWSAAAKYAATDSPTVAQWLATWGDKYDGAYLTRDYWEKTEDAYESKPDEKDEEVPYLADPRDWYNSWENTRGFKEGQQYAVQNIETNWNLFFNGFFPNAGWLNPQFADDGVAKAVYEQFNSSIVYVLNLTVAGGLIAAGKGPGDIGWANFNGNVSAGLFGYVSLLGQPMNWTNIIGDNPFIPGRGGAGFGNDSNYIHDLVFGVSVGIDAVMEGSWWSLEFAYPDNKAAHLLATLVSGQPVYVPQGDFMDKVIDTYDIDDDVLYRIPYVIGEKDIDLDGSISAIPKGTWTTFNIMGADMPGIYDLGGETKYVDAYVDVGAENGVVTFGIEYLDGQLDPGDVITGDLDPAELKDFEFVFAFGQYGSQDSTTVKDGDTEFWKSAGIDQIPGFEISIILGASALSIIGLIFVVMKKRKR